MAKKVAKKKVAKKKAVKKNGGQKGRKVSEKTVWIREQLKAGKLSVTAICKEGTEKYKSTVYGPQVYRIKKQLIEAGEIKK